MLSAEVDFVNSTIHHTGNVFEDRELLILYDGFFLDVQSDVGAFLARTWRKYGTEFNQHVDGAYGLVVVNKRTWECWLTNDPLGVHPIFYRFVRNSLAIESSLKKWQLESFEFDKGYLGDWLFHGGTVTKSTPVKGVSRLRRGECFLAKIGELRLLRRWHPVTVNIPKSQSLTESCEMLRNAVTEAHSKYTADLTQPLYELSGGLDSSTLVALAARQSQRKVKTMTWVLDPNGDDPDYRHSKILSRHYALDSTFVDAKNLPKLNILNIGQKFEEPGFEFAPEYLVQTISVLSQTGSDALVSGVGGDNLFGVYGPPPYWLSQTFRTKGLLELLRILRAKDGRTPSVRSVLKNSYSYLIEPLFKMPGEGSDEVFLEKILTTSFFNDFIRSKKRIALDIKEVWQKYYWSQIFALVGNRAALSYMMPYQYRYPLLHPRLLSIGAALQAHHNNSLSADRLVQRKAFADHLPVEIIQRTDKGSSIKSEIDYLSADGVLPELTSPEKCVLVKMNVVRHERWVEMIRRAQVGYFENIKAYDTLLKMELWLRSHSFYPPSLFN